MSDFKVVDHYLFKAININEPKLTIYRDDSLWNIIFSPHVVNFVDEMNIGVIQIHHNGEEITAIHHHHTVNTTMAIELSRDILKKVCKEYKSRLEASVEY